MPYRGHDMSTLFEQLGGQAAIDAVVDRFYDKVLKDDRVRHFFEGIDMRRQRAHQKAFLTMVFGGPKQYPGRSLRAAHQRLVEQMGLNDTHFDAIVEILGETLREAGATDDQIRQVVAIAESVRDDVLGRSPAETPAASGSRAN